MTEGRMQFVDALPERRASGRYRRVLSDQDIADLRLRPMEWAVLHEYPNPRTAAQSRRNFSYNPHYADLEFVNRGNVVYVRWAGRG